MTLELNKKFEKGFGNKELKMPPKIIKNEGRGRKKDEKKEETFVKRVNNNEEKQR